MKYQALISALLFSIASTITVAADPQGQGNSDRPAAAKEQGNASGQTDDPTTTQKQNSPREDPAYTAEAKKCESMQGNDKDKCIASAKKKAKNM